MIEDEALRGVLEFAQSVVRELARAEGDDRVPAPLRRYARAKRLDRAGLNVFRRVLEEDAALRAAILGGAQAGVQTAEVQFDAVEWLWLERPEGWEESIRLLLDNRLEERRLARVQLEENGAVKRVEAVERHLDRARGENERLAEELRLEHSARQEMKAELGRLSGVVQTLESQLAEARSEVRRAKQASESAERELSNVRLALSAAVESQHATEQRLDERSAALEAALEARVRAEAVWASAEAVSPDRVVTVRTTRDSGRRQPVPIPGGRYGNEVAVAEFLLAVPGAVVLVDGYNVAKTQWQNAVPVDLRERLLDLVESMVRRNGARVHVIFDGDEGTIGWTSTRRLVHVQFSAGGQTADDVIRLLARTVPETQALVVVTSDRELANSVRPLGANIIDSQQFLDTVNR